MLIKNNFKSIQYACMKMIFCFLPLCDKGSSFEQHEHQNLTVWKKIVKLLVIVNFKSFQKYKYIEYK